MPSRRRFNTRRFKTNAAIAAAAANPITPISSSNLGDDEAVPRSWFDAIVVSAFGSAGWANLGSFDRYLLDDSTVSGRGIDWGEAGGAIGWNVSGQAGITFIFGIGPSVLGGGQFLYQPIKGEFGFFGYGGFATHAAWPGSPVGGIGTGPIITTPMKKVSDSSISAGWFSVASTKESTTDA